MDRVAKGSTLVYGILSISKDHTKYLGPPGCVLNQQREGERSEVSRNYHSCRFGGATEDPLLHEREEKVARYIYIYI